MTEDPLATQSQSQEPQVEPEQDGEPQAEPQAEPQDTDQVAGASALPGTAGADQDVKAGVGPVPAEE